MSVVAEGHIHNNMFLDVKSMIILCISTIVHAVAIS